MDLVDFAEFTELVRVLPKGENLGLSKIMMIFRQKAVEESPQISRDPDLECGLYFLRIGSDHEVMSVILPRKRYGKLPYDGLVVG